MNHWPISPGLREYLEVQFQLRGVVGQGGMGIVLRAHERVLDRPVAIKVLRSTEADHAWRERFRREARIVARLTHPHIVPLYAFGEVGEELFFVMGFVEGESLAQRLQRERVLDEPDAVRILAEIADALAWAHGHGVIHRDVKPENVLIEGRTGRALLADFGIARELSASTSMTNSGVAVGTPHYMSPEQAASDQSLDHRSDLYSLGVLGYRLLTGDLPFGGDSAREVMLKHLTKPPAEIRGGDGDLSEHVAAAVMRCLEKDPARRWQDAAALRSALLQSDIEEVLPDDLAGVEGLATTLGGGALLCGWLWLLNAFAWGNELVVSILPAGIAALLAASVVSGLAEARRYGVRRALSVMLRPPRSWPLWWPRFARRPGDVWSRLPFLVRSSRTLLWGGMGSWAIVGATFLLVLVTTSASRVLAVTAVLKSIVLPICFTYVLSALAALVVDLTWRRRWLKEHGLYEGFRGLFSKELNPATTAPNASPAWRRPELARFLEKRGRAPRIPDTPERLQAVISDAVRALVDVGVLQNREAELVAAEVVRAIEEIDRELDLLARAGDAAELDKLKDRLASISAVKGGDAVREMLVRQKEAVESLLDRQAEKRARREKLVAELRELFVALDEIMERVDGADGADVSIRIRAVCEDLRHLARGYEAVAGMVRAIDAVPETARTPTPQAP